MVIISNDNYSKTNPEEQQRRNRSEYDTGDSPAMPKSKRKTYVQEHSDYIIKPLYMKIPERTTHFGYCLLFCINIILKCKRDNKTVWQEKLLIKENGDGGL